MLFLNTNKVEALSTKYTGITNVGASTINITDIAWNEPDSIETSGDISKVILKEGKNYYFFYWNCSNFEKGETKTGSFSLVYNEIGYDSSGDLIDLEINATVYGTNYDTSTISFAQDRYYGVCELRDSMIRGGSISWDSEMSSNKAPKINVEIVWEVTFTKSNAKTAATGNYLLYLYNIDVLGDSSKYYESVKLNSGFSSDVYFAENSTLEIEDEWIRSTVSYTNTDDSRSCFATLSDNNTFSFSNRSGGAMTRLFEQFSTKEITSNIYTSYDNGKTYSLDSSRWKDYCRKPIRVYSFKSNYKNRYNYNILEK